jgi:indole-3-glycerol phosphate synthase
VPEETVLITESGIHSRADVEKMIANEVYCFLIGEAFMREASPGSALVNLFPPSAN